MGEQVALEQLRIAFGEAAVAADQASAGMAAAGRSVQDIVEARRRAAEERLSEGLRAMGLQLDESGTTVTAAPTGGLLSTAVPLASARS